MELRCTERPKNARQPLECKLSLLNNIRQAEAQHVYQTNMSKRHSHYHKQMTSNKFGNSQNVVEVCIAWTQSYTPLIPSPFLNIQYNITSLGARPSNPTVGMAIVFTCSPSFKYPKLESVRPTANNKQLLQFEHVFGGTIHIDALHTHFFPNSHYKQSPR
jgi:hypothetical protein